MPTSPWMPFPILISALSKFLPPPTVALMSKYYRDHKVSTFTSLLVAGHCLAFYFCSNFYELVF